MKDKKPETKAEWALEQAEMSCHVGLAALNPNAKLHALTQAVERIVKYLQIKDGQNAK